MKSLVMGVGILAVLAAPVLANSVVNGTFETGVLAPWSKIGWGDVQDQGYFSVPINPAGGNKMYSIVSSWGGDWGGPVTKLSQMVSDPLVGGTKQVTVNFDRYLAARSGDTWRNIIMDAYISYMDDGSPLDPFDPAYHRVPIYHEDIPGAVIWSGDRVWENKTVNVSIPDTQFIGLDFEYSVHFAEWSWIGLDNVSIVSTPEPATLSLLLLALPLVRRRR